MVVREASDNDGRSITFSPDCPLPTARERTTTRRSPTPMTKSRAARDKRGNAQRATETARKRTKYPTAIRPRLERGASCDSRARTPPSRGVACSSLRVPDAPASEQFNRACSGQQRWGGRHFIGACLFPKKRLLLRVRVYIRACVRANKHACMRTYVCTYVHTCVHPSHVPPRSATPRSGLGE